MTRYERCLKRIKQERKEKLQNIIAIILFYVVLIGGVLLVHYSNIIWS